MIFNFYFDKCIYWALIARVCKVLYLHFLVGSSEQSHDMDSNFFFLFTANKQAERGKVICSKSVTELIYDRARIWVKLCARMLHTSSLGYYWVEGSSSFCVYVHKGSLELLFENGWPKLRSFKNCRVCVILTNTYINRINSCIHNIHPSLKCCL